MKYLDSNYPFQNNAIVFFSQLQNPNYLEIMSRITSKRTVSKTRISWHSCLDLSQIFTNPVSTPLSAANRKPCILNLCISESKKQQHYVLVGGVSYLRHLPSKILISDDFLRRFSELVGTAMRTEPIKTMRRTIKFRVLHDHTQESVECCCQYPLNK